LVPILPPSYILTHLMSSSLLQLNPAFWLVGLPTRRGSSGSAPLPHRASILQVLLFHFRCLRPSSVAKSFSTVKVLYGVGFQSHTHPTTWKTRVSIFVCIVTCYLSYMGNPTSRLYHRHNSGSHGHASSTTTSK
jgi:hypothetical protein